MSKSSGSVRVTYLDRDAVRRAVEQAVESLARGRAEIERVLLFGSLVRGDAVPGSDADLLIVLSDSHLRFLDRIPLYIPTGCLVGVDVFPYTREEIDQMVADGNWFIRRALAEGVEIYARRGSPTSSSEATR